jgi:hypothetical protein
VNESHPESSSRSALKSWLVTLIALHSYGVFVVLVLAPSWGLELGGWEAKPPLFFVRQAGVFHFILATGYLYEYFSRGTARLMIFTKTCATVFLLAETALDSVPWLVPFSGVTDGLMALAGYLAFCWGARKG